MRQQHPYRAIRHHVLPGDPRIVRIQRDVGASCLKNGQQPHDHVDGAFHRDAYLDLGHDPERDQPMRQPVYPSVQFGIAELNTVESGAKDQRQRFRPGLYLPLDQTVHRFRIAIALLVHTPRCDLRPLPLTQQVYLAQTALRVLGQLMKEMKIMLGEATDGARLEQFCRIG